MSVKLSPIGNTQVIDANGNPASGWKIATYQAGSSTPLATYTSEDGNVAQPAEITLGALGIPANPIWLTTGQSYKFVFKDANGVEQFSIDGVAGVNDTASSTATQWQSSSLTATYLSATSFSIPGDQTLEFHAGRRLQMVVSTGAVYGTILTATYADGVTTVSLVMDGTGALNSGLSSVSLSILRADPSAMPLNLTAGLSSGNLLINSAFLENIRAVAGTVTLAAGAYGHDRWKAGASGCTYTFATSGGVTTLTITAGSLIQVVEGSQIQSGMRILRWTGTAQGKIGGGSYGASGITANITGGTDLNIEFNTGTLSLPHLRPGTALLSWSPYNGVFGGEKQACRRYCRPIPAQLLGIVASSALFDFHVPHDEMRAAPTITLASSGLNIRIGGSTSSYGVSLSGTYTSKFGSAMTLNKTTGAAITANTPALLVDGAGTIGLLTAEL